MQEKIFLFTGKVIWAGKMQGVSFSEIYVKINFRNFPSGVNKKFPTSKFSQIVYHPPCRKIREILHVCTWIKPMGVNIKPSQKGLSHILPQGNVPINAQVRMRIHREYVEIGLCVRVAKHVSVY
jgi:hypothetical protein